MFINNELRDRVYRNNLAHGFWDNIRSYEELIHNLYGEFDETMHELTSGRKPTEVYFKKGNKPEGAPTELADIIIFILDYFGGSEPKIDIDEAFLEVPDEYYKNSEYYEQVRKKEPWKYFLKIRDLCKNHISRSAFYHLQYENESFTDENGEERSVPLELHAVIKLILEFCDVCEIDIEKELIDKINYNNSRPKDYRKMGHEELLETDPKIVFRETIKINPRMWEETPRVVEWRKKENNKVLGKRAERKALEKENDR